MTRPFCSIFLVFLCFFSLSAAAQNQPVSPAQFRDSLAGAEKSEIGLAAFQKLQAEGPVTVLDVRSKEVFAQRHIKGSLSLPLTDMTKEALEQSVPDKTAPVVVVCDNSFAPTRMIALSLQAYPVLKTHGYDKVYQLNLWHNAENYEEAQKALSFEGPPAQ